jgi:hypothetical protein
MSTTLNIILHRKGPISTNVSSVTCWLQMMFGQPTTGPGLSMTVVRALSTDEWSAPRSCVDGFLGWGAGLSRRRVRLA